LEGREEKFLTGFTGSTGIIDRSRFQRLFVLLLVNLFKASFCAACLLQTNAL